MVAFLTITLPTGCTTLTDATLPWSLTATEQNAAATNTARAKRLTTKAVHWIGEDQFALAAESLSAAIQADPGYGPAHNTLGLMHYTRENFFQAILAFEQAVAVMPENGDASYNLALALEAAGRIDEARVIYQQLVDQYPANPNYLGNLVRMRVRLGQLEPPTEEMLRDLVVIETRPKWRAWADRLLALDLNPLLDRGPPVPDFDSDDTNTATDQILIEDKIIDLSVETTTPQNPTPQNPTAETLPPPNRPKPRRPTGPVEKN